jgi:hypothetical protein
MIFDATEMTPSAPTDIERQRQRIVAGKNGELRGQRRAKLVHALDAAAGFLDRDDVGHSRASRTAVSTAISIPHRPGCCRE